MVARETDYAVLAEHADWNLRILKEDTGKSIISFKLYQVGLVS